MDRCVEALAKEGEARGFNSYQPKFDRTSTKIRFQLFGRRKSRTANKMATTLNAAAATKAWATSAQPTAASDSASKTTVTHRARAS